MSFNKKTCLMIFPLRGFIKIKLRLVVSIKTTWIIQIIHFLMTINSSTLITDSIQTSLTTTAKSNLIKMLSILPSNCLGLSGKSMFIVYILWACKIIMMIIMNKANKFNQQGVLKILLIWRLLLIHPYLIAWLTIILEQ